jgi:hypothetical protein
MLVYNIKRSISILGVPDLLTKLKAGNSQYKRKVLFFLRKRLVLKLFLAKIIFGENYKTPQNRVMYKAHL